PISGPPPPTFGKGFHASRESGPFGRFVDGAVSLQGKNCVFSQRRAFLLGPKPLPFMSKRKLAHVGQRSYVVKLDACFAPFSGVEAVSGKNDSKQLVELWPLHFAQLVARRVLQEWVQAGHDRIESCGGQLV